jgi:putative tryptophan/tyrosine transport system substrate-binding protein
MHRRELIGLAGFAAMAWPLRANAQRPNKIPKIGMLWHAGSADEEGNYFTSLMRGFADLGYVDGKTALFEHRYADEQYDRFPDLAKELVSTNVNVIMASILPAARAAAQVTKTIPIVFVIVSDPVTSGLADSLARPGRNLTGMSNVADDLTAKRVQIFKQAIPGLRRMGLIFNPEAQSPVREEYRAAAKALGIETTVLEVRSPADIEEALANAVAQRFEGVAAAPDSMIFNARERLAAWALRHRVPMMGANLDTVQAGALIAYGPNHADIFRRSAAIVDKILKGEKPGDIPVQRPVKFNLRINLRTAKVLDVDISPALLALADEVIE